MTPKRVSLATVAGVAFALTLVAQGAGAQTTTPCPGKDHAHVTRIEIVTSDDVERRITHCECDVGFVPNGGQCESPAIQILTHVDGALELPVPAWDCYCAARYVTRPNGRTHAEYLRTPEQQLAYELNKALMEKSASLTALRHRFFSTDDPTTATVKFIGREAIIHLMLAGVGTVAEARHLPKLQQAVAILEKASHANTAKEFFDLMGEVSEWRELQKELTGVTKDFRETIDGWWAANERAKNVPAIDHIIARPFTITFTSRAGESVAIVTRSFDGVTRGLTPIEPVSIDGSWNPQSPSR